MERNEKLWWKKQLLLSGFIWGIVLLILLFVVKEPELVQASIYEDAYQFYQRHGNAMVFRPGVDNVGEIYYGTMAKRNANTGIRYTTVGWKVRVFYDTGALAETLYYKLGGNQMTCVDVKTVNGYDYCLYRVTLTNIKSRLSKAGLEALNSPNCNIVFDACITTKINGQLQGEVTDYGPGRGVVYTTYNGIVHAQNWSAATKESLKNYYNKTVEGLFYEVNVSGGTGIKQVSGSGTYCFGTQVIVRAQVEDGYHFQGWEGTKNSKEKTFSFVLYGSREELVATAKENTYKFVFDAAGGQGMIAPQIHSYGKTLFLPSVEVWAENASLTGWTLSKDGQARRFLPGQEVSVRHIVDELQLQNHNGATIYFYAFWDERPYIETESIYVSLQDAKAGNITEEWLAEKAFAFDTEDGAIPYGKHEMTSFFMEDYSASKYKEIQKEGCVTERFLAVDSAGNISKKEVQVHVMDMTGYSKEMIFGRVRFISPSYFMDENGNLITEADGGLMENSIWRWDASFRVILENLFKYSKN